MKLAILETGGPPGDLSAQFGDYPAMFARMLGPEFEIEVTRRYENMPDPGAAIASLDAPNDRAKVGDWIRLFLTNASGDNA